MTGNLNLMTDIYSLGVVMLEVLTGKRPYFSKEEWEEMEKTEECVEEEKREECEQEGKNTEEDKEESEREEDGKTTEEWQHEWDRFGRQSLVSIALPLIEAGKLWKVLDRRPAAEPTPRQLQAVELVAQTAARCLRLQWEERPAISEVVANLEKALELARCDG